MRHWERFFAEFSPSGDRGDEQAAIRACQLAAQASARGTYGVGAVLLDECGKILIEGQNEVFLNRFRSDLHAEMVVMNRFEAGGHDPQKLPEYRLVSSLEPCPMCMTRLIFAGVGTIRYVKADDIGEMVQRRTSLPPIFQQITANQAQDWGEADCSEALRQAAFEIWDETRADVDARVVHRARGR